VGTTSVAWPCISRPRVMAAAQPGEILVSRTVRDLAAGADVTLEDRGMHLLKGVDGDWQLHAVARP
jgi:class 3 adenylate cyclase